jgi:hypothetical protein
MSQSFLDREGVLIVVVALVTLGLLGAGGYYLLNPPESSVTPDPGELPNAATDVTTASSFGTAWRIDTSAVFEYPGQDGWTVLDLLKADHSVMLDSELMLFGTIVLSIDSFEAGPGHYWLYYRDSVRGDRPAAACTTHSAEQIRWVLQKRK